MEKIIEQIMMTDITNINTIVDAVIKRYGELFPDWEISTVSVRRDEDKNKQLDAMIQSLQSLKD